MQKEKIEERLNAIKDIPFQYGKKVWTLRSFEFNDDREFVTLMPASGKSIEKNYEAVEYFLAELKPIEENKLASVKDDTTMPELIMVLRDMLLDDIAKIREDRTYIGQAKAINNNINTVINLARLQLILNRTNESK